ncbi:MAG TPA: RNA-binding protein [Candidatus Nanoarchaeia archaeon]|nr:RNA-binding protein [Candidatus Nanoarchaeia archaeon]
MAEKIRKEGENIKSGTNEIFIGNKPFMKYVIASLMQIKENGTSIIIKARGKFISKAVDVSEVVKKNLKEKGMEINELIKTSTDEFEDPSGRKIHVSTMDISLTKK